MRSTILRVAAAALLTVTTACTSGPSNEQFASVSQSGIAFTEQVPKVYDYALDRAIDEDSARWVKRRENLTVAEGTEEQFRALADQVEAKDKEFQETARNFAKLESHAQELRSYFVAVNALALGADSDTAAAAASGTATALGTLFKGLDGAKVLGTPLPAAASGITNVVLKGVSNSRLNENLQTYGPAVLDSIELQLSALRILAGNISQEERQVAEYNLAKAFADKDSALQSSWPADRRKVINFQAPVSPVTSAVASASLLHSSFKALLSGNNGALESLQRAITFSDAILKVFGS